MGRHGSMGSLFAPIAMPTMFALDAKKRHAALVHTPAADPSTQGPAIVDGTLYWGSGYSHLGFGGGNKKLFAFGRQDLARGVPSADR